MKKLLIILLWALLALSAQAQNKAREESVTIQKGDTLYSIAKRNGLKVQDIAAWNELKEPYALKIGQKLRLRPPQGTVANTPSANPSASKPETKPEAPKGSVKSNAFRTVAVIPMPPPPAAPTAPVAKPAETKPADSKPVEAKPVETKPIETKPVAATPTPVATTPETKPVATAPVAAKPATPTSPVDTVKPATPVPSTVSTVPLPSAGNSGIQWRWPTEGNVIARFVQGEQTQQGINIAGNSGQAVMAAADGVVVYSGAGLVGYGELIIIKHSEEWLSAYAHNRARLVKEGQKVKAGDTIAEMGRTGAVRDMLHFEIRRNGKPVDPEKHLPKR
jgi:lipoprotein NlpD